MMTLKKLLATAATGVSLIAAPIAASAAPANPATSLSLRNARAGTPTTKNSRLAAGSTATFIGVGILVAFTAIVLATTGDDDDSPDSN